MKRKTILGFVLIATFCCVLAASCGDKSKKEPTATMKLLRLDGTELDLTAKPIPRAVTIKATFDRALSSAEKTAVEEGFVFKKGDANVEKSFEWASDNTSVVAVPAKWFKYATTYTVGIADTAAKDAAETNFKIISRSDLNGDGYSDLVLMASGAPGGAKNGKVYIFYGKEGGIGSCDIASCTPDTTMTGANANDFLGASFSTGDFNADGYADLIIGASGVNNTGLDRGSAYIFLGKADHISNKNLVTDTADATIIGEENNSSLGWSVFTAGDVDGNGYDDILIGAISQAGNKGKAYVFLGGASSITGEIKPSEKASSVITGAAVDDVLGFSVSTAGDVNGDGFDDIVLGAPRINSVTSKSHAYVFHGSPTGIVSSCDLSSCSANSTITSFANTDFLGVSVSGAGDVNVDGYDDVIVGAMNAAGGGIVRGQAYIFHGSASGIANCDLSAGSCTPKATITGESDNDNLGARVAGIGRANGDEIDDVMVAAPGAEGGGTLKGRAYIFFGKEGGITDCALSTCHADATMTGATDNDELGGAIYTAYDTNADNFDDTLVAAPLANAGAGGDQKGQAYLFLGGSSLTGDLLVSNASATFTGAANKDWLGVGLGCSLLGGGNINSAILSLLFAASSAALLYATRRRVR